MITLSNVRDWLKTLIDAEHFYIGRLDDKQEKSVGVYTLKTSGEPLRGIGSDLSFDVIAVSVLVHWNNNANETEVNARNLFEKLRTIKNVTINDSKVYMIQLLMPEPIDVGTDGTIYERVIEFKLFYERK
jgi:hypothetical protein